MIGSGSLLSVGSRCTGCGACRAVCGVGAIAFSRKDDGFEYPVIDQRRCLSCGACINACPVLNESEDAAPLSCFAAVNPDSDVLCRSTSGGVFTALYRRMLAEGGSVFGCVWDDGHTSVHHMGAESESGCAQMRGSKYMQSECGTIFPEVREKLLQGKPVLFTGTPCQVAGLKRYLRRDYPRLLAVELVCHGVGSPKLWQRYRSELETKYRRRVLRVAFREKGVDGTIGGMFSCSFDNGCRCVYPAYSRGYSRAFLKGLCLRSSCFNCPSKHGRSGADIAMGDFWGIEHCFPSLDDAKGVSAVVAYTAKGLEALRLANLNLFPTTWQDVTTYNPSFYRSTTCLHDQREAFRQALKVMSVDTAVTYVLDGPWSKRVVAFAKRCMRYAKRKALSARGVA